MNGPLAQAVALVCHANAALRAGLRAAFFPDNSTCQFCRVVTFVELEGGPSDRPIERTVAATPDAWFARLHADGARAVELAYGPSTDARLPDRLTAGFVGGGGQWTLRARTKSDEVDEWVARWAVEDPAAADRRIWGVTYGLVGRGRGSLAPKADVPTLRRELATALGEIEAFAGRQHPTAFADCFRRAIGCLDGRAADAHHRDLAPSGVLPTEAHAMLMACQHAWVFGGMGSWNDMGFEGEVGAAYDRTSARLFSALHAAIVGAANASIPS